MQAGQLDFGSAMKQLFGKTYGKQMIICLALHVGMQFCGINAINYYSGQMFRCALSSFCIVRAISVSWPGASKFGCASNLHVQGFCARAFCPQTCLSTPIGSTHAILY